MVLRCLPVFGLCLISTLAFAAPLPGADAVAEYESANQAMEALQRVYAQLQQLPHETETERAKGRAQADELVAISHRMTAHLDNAIAGGHAVAMYQKAKLLRAKTIGKGNKAVCDLYGQAAELGLMAAALEYTKCLDFYPPTAEYDRRLEILRATVEGQDPYVAEYPLMTSFPYCFPKHKPALQPGEDAIAWVVDNARPLALSAEDFRAEGYYALAMTGRDEQTTARKAGFFRSAFAHGCREDSARIARNLGVTAPPAK